MKRNSAIACGLAGVLAMSQAAPAEAYDHWRGGHGGGGWHHGGGPILGLFALGAAVAVGTAELVTAPVRAIAEAPGYDAGPGYGYAQQPPQYYAQAQPPQAYYPQPAYAPPAYYAAPPVYYAAPPVYYGRPYYGR